MNVYMRSVCALAALCVSIFEISSFVSGARPIDAIEHVIVITQENWSFDALYSAVPGVDGLNNGTWIPQVNQTGSVYPDFEYEMEYYVYYNPAIQAPGKEIAGTGLLPNAPFDLCDHLKYALSDFTEDPVHNFYRHQYQINGGKNDKFVAYSNTGAMPASYVNKCAGSLPSIKWASEYTICTRFFQSAYGGSFINHQFLVASQAPKWNTTAKPVPTSLISVLNGPSTTPSDHALDTTGTYAVNTIYSVNEPYPYGTDPSVLIPPFTHDTIGDYLSNAGVSWKWYSGNWTAALNNPTLTGNDWIFQYHHQAYSYFAKYGPNTPGRAAHLADISQFSADIAAGTLPAVSWLKFYGQFNEHPGYSDLYDSQNYLDGIIKQVQNSPYWKNTVIIVTYDEFGGRFDHVPVPPQIDQFGPGSRIGTYLVGGLVKQKYVDPTYYYTHDSINKFLTIRFNLPTLNHRVDQAVTFDAPFNWMATGNCCPTGQILVSGGVCNGTMVTCTAGTGNTCCTASQVSMAYTVMTGSYFAIFGLTFIVSLLSTLIH